MKTIIQQIKVIALGIVIAVGASYVFAWAGPTSAPPGGNVAAPINVSSSTQSKLGSLILNAATPIQNAIGLTVFGTSSFNGVVQIADGTQGAGKVLTSDANGDASWQAGASSSSGVTRIIAGEGIMVSPSGGTGTVTVNATTTGVDVVVGGCWLAAAGKDEGNAYYAWGNATNNSGSCFCPSGFTAEQVGTDGGICLTQ